MQLLVNLSYLIAVSDATHARHDAKNVVVDSIDVEVIHGKVIRLDVVIHVDVEDSSVNAGHVKSAGRLVLLGLEREGINIDTGIGRNIFVVLEGLNGIEIKAIALSETVVAIENKFGISNGVEAISSSRWGEFGSKSSGSDISRDEVGIGSVIHPILVIATSFGDNPDKFFTGMVEVEFRLDVSVANGFLTGKLELLDEVLVRELSETSALIGIKEDVIDP